MIRRFACWGVLALAMSLGTDVAVARNLRLRQPAEAEELRPPPIPLVPGDSRTAPRSRLPSGVQMPGGVQKDWYGQDYAAQKVLLPVGAPCVRYVHHRVLRKTCCDPATVQTVLTVYDPYRCCEVGVPVCVPVCCTDVPTCDGRAGLLGRDITNFSWCCGYRVRIVVDRHGDLAVHSYGS